MEVLVFLIGLGCLVLLVWAMAAPAVPGIAFMGMPVAVACAKPDGVCHNLRVMALETKKTVLLPQVLWDKLTRKQ